MNSQPMSIGPGLHRLIAWQHVCLRLPRNARAWCVSWNGVTLQASTGLIPSTIVVRLCGRSLRRRLSRSFTCAAMKPSAIRFRYRGRPSVLSALYGGLQGEPFVFPGARSGLKPISENAIGYLYNREGYKGRHVPHGWRSSFSTIMNEQAERELGNDVRLLADRMIIDLMLAHTPKGMSASELRYNRAAYMPRRRELAQRWADMIMEGAIPPGEIVDSPRRKRR